MSQAALVRVSKTQWNALDANGQNELVAKYKVQSAKSQDKTCETAVGPGTVTPMYSIGQMQTCERDIAALNGGGPYRLVLSDENVFDGSMSSEQHIEQNEWVNGKVKEKKWSNGVITVKWQNCAVCHNDGDLYLYETAAGLSVVQVTMTGYPDTLIANGKLISGGWPLFLSVYTSAL